jgi:hypothetical protein
VEADPPEGALSIDTLPSLVGGLDISFFDAQDGEAEAAVAALVVLSAPTLDVLYEDLLPVTLTQPYAAGYLAFREAPALVELIRRLRTRRPDLVPQVLLVDGNGVLHPRACGLACHVVRCRVGLPSLPPGLSLLPIKCTPPLVHTHTHTCIKRMGQLTSPPTTMPLPNQTGAGDRHPHHRRRQDVSAPRRARRARRPACRGRTRGRGRLPPARGRVGQGR